MLAIQDYDIQIEHIAGTRNYIADTLSRMTKNEPFAEAAIELLTARSPSKEISEMLRHLAEYQRKDTRFKSIITGLENGQTIRDYVLHRDILCKGFETKRAVLPEQVAQGIIKEVHELYAHIGAKKCVKMIEESFIVKNLRKRAAEYVKSCDSCQRNKTYTQPIYAETAAIVPNGIGDLLSIDFYGPLPTSKGGVKYILAIIDTFSKFVCLYPIKKEDTRTTVRKLREYIELYGKPKRVQTDHGTQFTAKSWKVFLEEEGIKHIFSAIRHPQSNMVERINKELGRFFRTLTGDKHKNWASWIPLIRDCLNETYHETIETTPRELHTNTKPRRIWTQWIDLPETRSDHRTNVQLAYQHIRSKGEKRANRANRHQPFTTFSIGDLVLVKACNVSSIDLGVTAKFLALFEGPYVVEGMLSKCTYILRDKNTGTVRGKFHISSLRPYYGSEQPGKATTQEVEKGHRDKREKDLPITNPTKTGGGPKEYYDGKTFQGAN